MQPDQPNPYYIVLWIFNKMSITAGVKEEELQGSSSLVREGVGGQLNSRVTAMMQGET